MNNQKVPYFLKPHEEPGLLLAGLWDRWRNPETDDLLESFTVLTVPASPAMEQIHKRQPLMLSVEDARTWMDADNTEFQSLISSELPVDIDAVPVSTYVNNARNKDDRCMDPIGKPITLDDGGALL
jgi:putative SOS response-associated peptidase YedK